MNAWVFYTFFCCCEFLYFSFADGQIVIAEDEADMPKCKSLIVVNKVVEDLQLDTDKIISVETSK